MKENSSIRPWLQRGLIAILATGVSYLIIKKIKSHYFQKQIKRIPKMDPSMLTFESLMLILKETKRRVEPKIRKILQDGRANRMNMQTEDNSYTQSVKNSNQRIVTCIQKILSNVLKEMSVIGDEFERSLDFCNDIKVRNELFNLRRIEGTNPPTLTSEQVTRILHYYIQVMRNMREISQIELLDLELALTQCEDKVFQKFGVEKADVEKQAELMGRENEEIRNKLAEYQRLAKHREETFQDNINVGNLHGN